MGAIGLAVVVVALPLIVLALTQASTRDELLTLAQVRDATLGTLRATYAHPTPPPAPPAYLGLVWAIGRALPDALLGLRALSIAGWLTGSVALGVVVRRNGAGPVGTFVAVVLPTATGLASQGMVARPYGLVFGAGGFAIACWDATLRSPSRTRSIGLAVAVLAVVALHYWALSLVTCLVLAERRARTVDRQRPIGPLVALGAAVVPLVVAVTTIARTISVERAASHPVLPEMAPRFYGSTLISLAPALVFGGVVAIVLLATARRDGAAPSDASGGASRFLGDPVRLLTVLLVATVPAQVVLGAAILDNAYLHRYAIAAVFGFALAAGFGVGSLERRAPRLALVAAVVVAASVPIAAVRAIDDAPARRQVAAIAAAVEAAGSEPVLVPDAYLHGALLWSTALGQHRTLVQAGPTTIPGDRPELDLTAGASAPGAWQRVLVLVDEEDLAAMERAGRLRHVEVVDRLPLDHDLNSGRRTIVLARADVDAGEPFVGSTRSDR
ncbi:MAG: hypothetical protein ACTHN0_07360 [Aquihabitans sp.]